MRRKKKCSGLSSLNPDALLFAIVFNNLNSNRLNRYPQILEVYSKLHSAQSNREGQALTIRLPMMMPTYNALYFGFYNRLGQKMQDFNAGFRYVLASRFITRGIHSY